MEKKGLTYRDAGVDLVKASESHKIIGRLIEKTFSLRSGRFGEVVGEYGHYANLIDIGSGRALAVHSDGVGTKVLIAQLMDKYDTVGIDCVAMNVNDLICIGAEPLAIVDYLAIEKSDPEMVEQIIRGLVKGAEMASIAILGGETATMPGVIKGAVEGKGFDLVAMSIGMVYQDKVITGEKIVANDVIIGLQSSGIHSNGFSLARKALLDTAGFNIFDPLPGSNQTVGTSLLEPTKIYVREVLEILEKVEVHGLANITGGAFSKLNRICYGRIGMHIDQLPDPQPIFQTIKQAGNISDYEMYRTFNMGVGFVVVAPRESSEIILSICKKAGTQAQIIGKTTKKKGIILEIGEDNLLKM
ncbi:MAG: phosphoribosylformylglycinamidine cyclo-ligase [Candidatus Jordarchaeum sp.]|uniref:phosphoribosylformylglycinamidine cyclo-ligase n=1 Tax=Candidatus Jordarchaeum sp. TaxID=2823881 RepID=UPI00404A2343